VRLQTIEIVIQSGFVAIGPGAVRTPGQLHLKHPQVEPNLELLFAIRPSDLPSADIPRIKFPVVENERKILVHRRPPPQRKEMKTGKFVDAALRKIWKKEIQMSTEE
jgi:hypothetical protein